MDIFIYVFVIFLGICAGIFTGLLPGIHINLVASFAFVNLSYLLNFLELKFVVIFILAMGVTHSFIDFIPSVIFGVPSTDTALSVLPTHRMVQQGYAYRAIYLSAVGSLLGVFFALIFIPVFSLILEQFYSFAQNIIVYVLIFVLVVLVLTEEDFNKKFWAAMIVLLGGGLGSLVLNSTFAYMPILSLFSGLFGTSALIMSLIFGESKLPKQKLEHGVSSSKGFFKASFFGSLASGICLVVPGIGNSQAATIVSLFFRNVTSELFIVVVGAINTFSFFMSLITLHLISRSRNGAVLIVSQIIENIDVNFLKTGLLIMTIVGIVGFLLTLFLGKLILSWVAIMNMEYVNIGILVFLIIVVFELTGFYGLLILICSTFLGILCVSLEVRRIHLMSVLIIPIIMNLI